ncbi:hypothetical protein ACWEQO_34420, partial [Streptomyces sp. NPDC004051]
AGRRAFDDELIAEVSSHDRRPFLKIPMCSCPPDSTFTKDRRVTEGAGTGLSQPHGASAGPAALSR